MKKYIDRDALAEYAHCQYGMVTASDIMEFPTADVQPVKRGYWVNEGCLNMYCSNCGETSDSELGYNPYPSDFCPFCGWKMYGDGE